MCAEEPFSPYCTDSDPAADAEADVRTCPRLRSMTPRALGITLAVVVLLAGCTNDPSQPTEAGTADTPTRDAAELEAGLSQPVADPLYPDHGNPDIDVLHYGMALDYQPDTRTLSGTVTLTIRPVVDASEVALDFSDAMEISSITVDGESADFTLSEYDLVVDTPVTADNRIEMSVTYSGEPKRMPAPAERGDMTDGIGASVDRRTGALWSFQEPFGAMTWYPVNDQPSDKALYDFAITVPDGYSAVASGTFMGQEGNTFTWSSSAAVASYLTTIAVDKYEMHEATGPDGLPITYWVPPQYPEFEPVLERLPEILGWLSDRYGPYPFDTTGVVLVGGHSAMETQQMVTFSGGMAYEADPEYVAGVVLHELSHQWFGDAVTPQDWSGLWLNEGAATYSEQMWQVDQGNTTEEQVVGMWTEFDGDLRAEFGPPGAADPDAFASSNSYYCPALMLYHMRDLIGGADAVNDLLAAWVEEFDGDSVTRTDFIDFANEHTGEDLTDYINTWLDSPTTPDVD